MKNWRICPSFYRPGIIPKWRHTQWGYIIMWQVRLSRGVKKVSRVTSFMYNLVCEIENQLYYFTKYLTLLLMEVCSLARGSWFYYQCHCYILTSAFRFGNGWVEDDDVDQRNKNNQVSKRARSKSKIKKVIWRFLISIHFLHAKFEIVSNQYLKI